VVTNVQLVDETYWNTVGCRQHRDATVLRDVYNAQEEATECLQNIRQSNTRKYRWYE